MQNVSYLAQRNDARENTPPEEINSEVDRVFADDERRIRARASEDDSSYNPVSVRKKL